MVAKGIIPEQFVNKLLDQHFYPWKYAEYENILIDRALSRLEPTPEELEIVKKYLSYEILRDFKTRMYQRYQHTLPMFSLEYYMKRLSIAVVENNFNEERIAKFYCLLIDDIKKKDPDFNLRTYIDNMIRLRYMPTRQRKVINKIEQLNGMDPLTKRINKRRKK